METPRKNNMKIPRSEFKTIIKECLKELISEGALNNAISQIIQVQGIPVNGMQQQQNMMMQAPMDPRIQAVAQSAARGGGDAKLYEAIFADALGTMNNQNGNDMPMMMQNNMNTDGIGMGGQQNMMMNPGGSMNNNGYFNAYPQQQQNIPQQYMNMQQGPMMQQQMMPMQQQGQPQQQLSLRQPQQGGNNMSRWAQLAYNSPIKNRPASDDGGPLTLGNIGPAGSSKGNFG